MSQDNKTIVTLRQIAETAGISVDAARRRAKRRDRDGVWRILPSNHPQDPLRIELPQTDLDGLRRLDPAVQRRPGADNSASSTARRPEADGAERQGMDVKDFAETIIILTDRLNDMIDRFASLERERSEARIEAETARAEARYLRERIEAAAASHHEDSKRHATETEKIRNSKDAEIERLRSTLADMRARTWWRRLAG